MNIKKREFIALQKEWYSRLKKSGFDDIEYMTERGDLHQFLRRNPAVTENGIASFESTLSYYMLASQFLHEHVFKDKKEKRMWEGHSEGETFREISSKTGVSVASVFRIVTRLRAEMFESNKGKIEEDECENASETRGGIF